MGWEAVRESSWLTNLKSLCIPGHGYSFLVVTYFLATGNKLEASFVLKRRDYTYPSVVLERWWSKCSWDDTLLQESQASSLHCHHLPVSSTSDATCTTFHRKNSCAHFKEKEHASYVAENISLQHAQVPSSYSAAPHTLMHMIWELWGKDFFLPYQRVTKGPLLSVGDFSRSHLPVMQESVLS